MSAGTNVFGSDVTRIRKARALFAFRSANTAAVNVGTSVLPEQGPPPLNSEYLSRIFGGLQLVQPYPTASSQIKIREVQGCGCSVPAPAPAPEPEPEL